MKKHNESVQVFHVAQWHSGIFAFCQDNTGKGEYIEGMCLDLAKRVPKAVIVS